MKTKYLILHLLTLMVLASCFDSGSDEAAGGGLFSGHQQVENGFAITLPADRVYSAGENMDFVATHPSTLTVTGNPRVALDIGGSSVFATYLTGSGTKNLTFRYTVTNGDNDSNGIDVTPSIDLNGGTVQFVYQGVVTNADGSSISLGSTAGIQVDTTAPSLTAVTPPIDDLYYFGEQLQFLAVFDDNVVVSGTPQISITLDSGSVLADYATGSGSSTLIFNYIVGNSDADADGIVYNSPLSLNGGTIQDVNGNDATISFVPIPSPNVQVDGDSPTVISYTYPADNTYLLGEAISFSLTYSETVTVAGGTPTVDLDIGGTTVQASYAGGTGTDTLNFQYIVAQGLYDIDGITIQNSIALNGATIQDAGSANARLDLTPSLTPMVRVDSRVPDITSITAPANSNYLTGQDMDFVFQFDEPVVVTNTPRVQIQMTSGTVNADYIGGSGSSALTFRYTVQAADADNDGVLFASNALDLNTTGTIRSMLTLNDANLGFAGLEPDMTGVRVNESLVTQLVITTQPTNTYQNQNINPSITVELRDVSNNLVVAATDNVTVAFGTDPSAGAATLGGTLTVGAIGGIATFSDINIDTLQSGYTLTFSSGALTPETSLPFDIIQAPATQLVITAQPTDAVAGVNIAPDITVELRDASNNLVTTETSNVTLNFGTDPSAGAATIGGTVTVAAVGGIATFNDINIDKAFTGYTLTASSGALTTDTSNTFNITPAAKAQLAFTVQPSDANSLVAIAPAIEVQVQDAFGNVTADTDSITLVINNNPGTATLGGTATVAAVAGTASFNDITLDAGGVGYTLDATAAGLTTATSDPFTITVIPTQLIITQQPTDAGNSIDIAPAITVELRDASNNLVPTATDNVTVAFGTDPSAGAATLNGTLTVAAVGGVATFSDLDIDTINNGYTLDFTSGALTGATSNLFNIIQAPATQLVFTQEPTNAVAGVNIAPAMTVEFRDANNLLVPNETSNVTLTFGTDPSAGAATIGGTVTVAAVGGVATFNDINIDKAFTGYQFNAASGALTPATSTTFDISPAAKSQLAFSVEPSDADMNVNIAPAIEVQIQDAFGNITNDTDSITLAINSDPSAGSATLGGTLTLAAVAGSASFNDINIDFPGAGYTLDATAAGLTTGTSASFNINAVPTQLAITQEPTNTDQSSAITPAITVEIRDANNNLVAGATDNITVAFGTDPSAGAATLGGTLTVAAVGGIATFSDLDIDTVNTGYTLTFTSGALTAATSDPFDIVTPAATQLVFVQNPSNAVAGVNIAPAMTVEFRDASNSLVTSETSNVTLSFGTDPSAGAATIGGTVTVAAVGGVATFNDINIDKAFTGYVLNADSGALTTGVSTSFDITPATATQLAFSVEPTDAVSGVAVAPAIEVQIQDAFGNVTADTDSITLAINNNAGPGGTLAGTLSVNAVAGTASFNDINIDIAGVGYTLDASATGLTTATSAAFNITQIPTQLIITQQPTDAGNSVNIAPSITVEIRDASNNLVTGATDNVTVAIGTDPSAGAATLGGTLTIAAVGGVATFADINIDTVNNGYDLSFTSGALTGATSNLFNITQAPATQLAFTQDPTNAVAGVNIAPAITVEFRDANNLLVPTETSNVTLNVGTDPSSGTVTLGGTLTVAAVGGVATFSDINLDKAFTAYTLAASSGALTPGVSASFDITPAAKSQLAISVEPTDAQQNASIAPSIEVQIQDAFGNVTADTDSITLAINNNAGPGGVLSGTLSQTAVAGTAIFNDISIDVAGVGYTLDATAAGLTTATTTGFNITQVPTQLIITQEPTNADNDVAIAPSITVEIRDAANNIVATATDNVTVAIGTDPSAGAATLGGTLTVAAIGGVATFSDLSIDTINTGYTLDFTATGLTTANSASFDITPAAATQLVFTQDPTNTVAGVNIAPAMTVEFRDASNNLVTGETSNVILSFGTDPSAGAATLGGTLTVAAVGGVATFNDINIDKAFTGYVLNADSGALTTGVSASFNITPAAKSQLAISVEPTDAQQNASIAPSIEVQIQDAFGNVTADTDSITLAINNNAGPGGTLAGTLTQAAVAGTAVFNDISIDVAGVGYTLDATAAGLTTDTSAAFNITQVPTQLIITQEPTNTDNGVAIAPAITVEIRDATNSLVATATDNVTVAIGTDPSAGAATLGGTLTVAAVGGVATFSDLNIDIVNTGYTLDFTSAGLTTANSASFNITQGAATQLVFTQDPTNTVAGVNIAPAMTVEFRDVTNALVPTETSNVTLSFGVDPSTGTATLGGTVTVAAVGGVATFSDINIDKAFTGYVLNADSGALTTGVSAGFNITPAAKSQLAFSVEPSDASQTVAIAPSIEVQILDAFGNVTADTDSITLAINNNAGPGGVLSGTLSQSAVAGTATFNDISIDVAGVGYTLDATAAGLTTDTSAAFNITQTATQLVITQQPTDAGNSVDIAPAITVEIRDAANNLVSTATDNVSVAIGTDPSAGAATLAGTLTVAAVGGVATFSDLDIDTINNGYTLVFTSGALTGATSNTFNITQAPATQLVITQQPVNTVAGVFITPNITVEIRDANNLLVSDATDIVTFAIGTDPSAGAGTLSGTASVSAVGGIATFNDLSIDKAFNSYDLVATATGLTDATSNAFNITPAAKSQLAFSVEPSDEDQNVNIAPTIQVEIQDAFGNKTTDTDTITLAINNNAGPGGTLSGTLAQAAVAGVASFNDINIDVSGTGYTLDATAGGLTTATSAAFNIVAVPTQLVITQEPTDADENAAIAPAITVEIRDAANNLVTSATDNVTVAIGTNPSAGTLAGTATVAAVGGVATFSDLNINNSGNGYTLSFSSGALTGATSAAFNINKVPTQIIITQEPTNADRGVVIAPAITVELRDASNTLVTSATNTVTVAIGTDPSAGSAALGGTTSVAAVGGIATFNNLTIDTINNGYDLVFSSGALTPDTSASFNITQPPATQLVFVQQPTNTELNTNIAPSITVEFRDASNQIVSNETSNVTLAFGTDPSGGSAVLSGTLTVAAVNGVATFNDIQIDTVNTGYTLNASSGALTPDTSSAFDILPGATVAITTSPAINNANSSTYGTSGTCSEEGITVTITIAGTLTDTPTCTGGAWSSTIDVSSLIDGPTISIQADHDVASDSTTVVKDTTPAVISSVTTANSGNLVTGNVLTYTVTFNEPVTVTTGLGVDTVIGTNTRSAVCGTATASTTVTCNYTIVGGDTDDDGMVTSSPLTQGAATVTDAYGNTTAFFNFTPPDTSGIFANGSSNIIWRDSGGTPIAGGTDTWGTNENPPSATRVYQVYNAGGASTTGLSVSGQGANKFFQIIGNTCGAVLPGGTFCEVTIEHFECKGGCGSGATNSRTFRANDGSNVNLVVTGYEAP